MKKKINPIKFTALVCKEPEGISAEIETDAGLVKTICNLLERTMKTHSIEGALMVDVTGEQNLTVRSALPYELFKTLLREPDEDKNKLREEVKAINWSVGPSESYISLEFHEELEGFKGRMEGINTIFD